MKNEGEFRVGCWVPDPAKKSSMILEKRRERFSKRKKARNWCRNNFHAVHQEGMVIIHPDGTKEDYEQG